MLNFSSWLNWVARKEKLITSKEIHFYTSTKSKKGKESLPNSGTVKTHSFNVWKPLVSTVNGGLRSGPRNRLQNTGSLKNRRINQLAVWMVKGEANPEYSMIFLCVIPISGILKMFPKSLVLLLCERLTEHLNTGGNQWTTHGNTRQHPGVVGKRKTATERDLSPVSPYCSA